MEHLGLAKLLLIGYAMKSKVEIDRNSIFYKPKIEINETQTNIPFYIPPLDLKLRFEKNSGLTRKLENK